MSTVQIAGVVVGDNHACIQAALTDRGPESVYGEVVASEAEAFALGEGRDQFPALRSCAVIDHPKTNIRHRRAQREAKQR